MLWSEKVEIREDDKEPIEDKMRDDHLYRILDKDTWMINIIRAYEKCHLIIWIGTLKGE